MRVAGIGQCSLDYLAIIDGYPRANTKKEVLEWNEQGGGPVATALVTLSRLGIPCTFHGIIGDDCAGQKIRQSLIDERIDVTGLVKRKNAGSQLAFIAIEKRTGERTIFWKRPSGGDLKEEDLGTDFLSSIDFLLLDGLMKDASLHAVNNAKSINIPVMLDAGRNRPGMIEIAQLCDYVVASEEFSRDIGWSLDPESLLSVKEDLGVKLLTVTLGERGSITASKDQVIQIPAFEVKAVDTTGAGDVFHGGYIYGLLNGWDIKNTVIFASALAAMKCTKVGGRGGIPKLNEALTFLKAKGYMLP
jgi:sulfofructose kinase